MVSFHSCPGSRRCACMSMKPGATISPRASITCAPFAGISRPSREILPSSIHTSSVSSVLEAGSTTRPPLSKSFTGASVREQIQDRHPNRDAVRHLLEDDGGGPVGHVARELDAPVDRSGVHDDRVGAGQAQALDREPELLKVLAHGWEE